MRASLKATFIRQAIQRALNKSRQHANETKVEVPQLIVYDYPTVERLAAWVQTALSSDHLATNLESSIDSHVAVMQALADKYSLHGPPSDASTVVATRISNGVVGNSSLPRVILITGTTGALGCHMLQQLALDTHVHRIYAVGRASDEEQLRARQRAALKDRGLSTDILDGSKIVMFAAEVLGDIAEDKRAEVPLSHLDATLLHALTLGADESNCHQHLPCGLPAQFQSRRSSI